MHSYSRNFIIILLWSFFLWELFLQFPFCLIRQLIPNVLNSKYPFVQAPPHAGCRKSLLVTFQGSFWTQCWETKFRDLPILSRITNICYSGLKEYCKYCNYNKIKSNIFTWMNFFTSGSLFNRHPAHDSTLTEWGTDSSSSISSSSAKTWPTSNNVTAILNKSRFFDRVHIMTLCSSWRAIIGKVYIFFRLSSINN